MLRLTTDNEVVTSIEGPGAGTNAYMMCFGTTDRIVWVDSRHAKTSVLSWRHHRAYDRTLEAKTVVHDRGGLLLCFPVPAFLKCYLNVRTTYIFDIPA